MRNLILLTLWAGCSSDTTNNGSPPDMSCVQGATACVNDSLAQVCSGGVWLSKPCAAGSVCANGDCTASGVPCAPGAMLCGSSTTSLTCNPSGFGYASTDCPPGTQCVGAGFCVGSCIVGITKCSGNSLLTCADGFSFSATPCATDEICVTDLTRTGAPGVCAKGDCTPDLINGCNSVCGIMGPSPSPAAANWISTCTNTNSPLGWRWLATQCVAPKSCDPTGADCALSTRKQQAACVSQCTPGAVRCMPVLPGIPSPGTQTCDSNGNWQTSALCSGGQTCTTLAAGTGGNSICADPACVNGAFGVCVDVGGVSQILACTNGKLATTPSPCSFGVCVRDNIVVPTPPFTPGVCAPECRMGDLLCRGGGTETCNSNGTWSTTITACPAGTFCNPYQDPITAQVKAVCGVCSPGARRCVDANGTPAGGTQPNFEICDGTGQWGPSTACTLGQCTGASTTPCEVDCIPGSLVCVGAPPPSPLPGIPYPGTSAVATCTAQGLNPGRIYPITVGTDPCWIGGPQVVGVACCSTVGGGIFGSCRSDVSVGAIGCVACVGAGTNEAGLIDTRCSNDSGTDFGTAAVQTCAANNSGWGPAVMCPNLTTCHPPTPTPGPVPASQINPSCNPCIIAGFARSCTEGTWNLFGSSCVDAGLGGVMSCGISPDCCAAACYVTSPPTPALCGG
jgi:hypothetical protein